MENKEINNNEEVLVPYNLKSWLKSSLLGFFIGLAVIVPGISGSTISIIFKLYDKLLYSISNIFKKFKLCFLFLLPIIVGGLLGILLGFFTIKELIKIIPFSIVCLFAGLMCGSAPSIKNEIKNDNVTPIRILLFILGILIPLLISIFSTLFKANSGSSFDNIIWYEYIICILIGFVIAITQLIPGLSATSFLMSIGYFKKIMSIISFTAIKNNPFYILILFCLLIGFVIGLFIISKLITLLFKNHKIPCFFMIFGFVIGSILTMFFNPDIFNTYIEWSNGSGKLTLELSLGIPLFVVGILIGYLLLKHECFKNNAKSN